MEKRIKNVLVVNLMPFQQKLILHQQFAAIAQKQNCNAVFCSVQQEHGSIAAKISRKREKGMILMTELFHTGDHVVYGAYGVCSITGTTEKEIGAKKLSYYVLKPVFQQNSTVFVPVENEQLTSRLRKVLTRQEMEQLIDSLPEQQSIWIDDETERRNLFQKILSDGDRVSIIRLAKTLYHHQQERIAKGKRLHQSDERFFREADRLICDEFAFVLQKDPGEIPAILQQKMEVAAG